MNAAGKHRQTTLCALIVAVLTFACGRPPDPSFVQPLLRTAPTKFVAVSGEIDRGLDVQLAVEYQTTDRACEITTNRLEGVRSPQIYRQRIEVHREGTVFNASVPLDIVAEPRCAWKPTAIQYTVYIDGTMQAQPEPFSALVWFRDGAADSHDPFAVSCERLSDFGGTGYRCGYPPGDYFVSPELRSLRVSFHRAGQ